jgi:hypothetical protein
MSRPSIVSVACTFVVVPAVFVLGCGGKPKVEPAATPEEAVQQLQSAENNGDLEAYTAVLPQAQRDASRRFFEAALAMEKGAKVYVEAVKARFGDEAKLLPFPMDVKAVLTDPAAKYEVIGKTTKADGREELKVKHTRTVNPKTHATKTDQDTLTAVQEEDGWKIERHIPPVAEDFERQAKAFEEVATRVRAGEFQDQHEALSALVKAWQP